MLGCWLVTKTHTRDGVDYVSRAADRGVVAPIAPSWLTALVINNQHGSMRLCTPIWLEVSHRRVRSARP